MEREESAQKVRDALIEQYSPLVAPLARALKRQLPDGYPLEDLIGWGQLGLVKAAAKADRARNFRAVAICAIRGAMLDACRLKRNRIEVSHAPLAHDLAAKPDWNPERSAETAKAVGLARRAVASLDPSQRKMLYLRLVACMNQTQAGRVLGMSRSSAQRIEYAAAASLRSFWPKFDPRALPAALGDLRIGGRSTWEQLR